MATEGHCNCGGVRVKIPAMPSNSAICYCSNCQRSSAGLCSVNYLFDLAEIDIQDPQGYLKSYNDSDTKSGNTITRRFCGNCGSPILSLLSPDSPKVILKGGLFDQKPEPNFEVFTDSKPAWMKVTKPGEAEKL